MEYTAIKQLKIPTLEQLKRICASIDPTTWAWICCQKDSGLSTLDLFSIKAKNISDQLNNIPIHIEIYHKMSRAITNTFFGSNSKEALEKYLANRNNDQLFDIRRKIICNRLQKLDLTPYALRKFFYNNMVKAHVPLAILEHWMGHAEPTISLDQMKNIYIQAYPYIDISKKD